MKRLLLMTLLACIAFLFGIGCTNEEEQPVFAEPMFVNITADVSDKPEGVFLGDAELTAVSLDGNALGADQYIVRDKYFIFTYEYYGEIGAGKHTAEYSFSNYSDVNVELNITDSLPPDYTMPEDGWYEYSAEQSISLPEITRNRMYQEYELSYALKNGEDTVFEAGDGKPAERPVIESGFAAGEYIYTASVVKDGVTLEEKNYNIFIGTGQNLFSAENFENSWELQATAYMNMEFDAATNAVKVNKAGDTGCEERLLTSPNRRLYTDTTVLKEAYAAGFDKWSFSYYSELSGDFYGFRIYRREGHGTGDCGTEYLTVSSASGITDNAWTTLTIDLSVLFGGANVNCTELSITVVGENGTSIYFRNGYFSKTDYSEMNFFDESSLAMWTAQATPQNIKSEYDADMGAVKVTRVTDNTVNEAQYTSNNNRIYLSSLDYFTKAYQSGYKTFTFEYYSELTAGTSSYIGFRIYGNNASNQNGYIYDTVNGETLINGAWTKYTIDLEKLFAEGGANTNGLSLVILGNADSRIYFRNGFLEN